MKNFLEIPQDIIDNVIAAVGDDTRSLKQCTLVSSSFLRPSRKQLFSTISIRSDQTCQGIHQLLVKNPVILSIVRTITIKDSLNRNSDRSYKIPEWMNGASLPAILRLPFRCLECFSIIMPDFWVRNSWNWTGFSRELKDALSNIILSSTLKTLSFTGVTVPTFFFQTLHLPTLELHSLLPIDFGGENSSSFLRAATKEVGPMASHAVIDRCVWHLPHFLELCMRYEILFIFLYLTNSGQRRSY